MAVTLHGFLHTGIAGIGGEHAGAVLQLSPLWVELIADEFVPDGERRRFAGPIEIKSVPSRPFLRVLRASAAGSVDGPVTKPSNENEATVEGTYRHKIVIGGGSPSAQIEGAVVEVDLSRVGGTRPPTGSQVAVEGTFTVRSYIERGDVYVFEATAVHLPKGRPEGAGGVSTFAAGASGGGQEASGYSEAFDFGAAFLDAVSKLPPIGGDIMDFLDTPRVKSIHAEFGGIAGLHRLVVTVTRD